VRKKDRKRKWRDEGIHKLGKDVRKTDGRDKGRKSARERERERERERLGGGERKSQEAFDKKKESDVQAV